MMPLLVLAHLTVGAAVLLLGRRLGRHLFTVALLPLAASVAAIATEIPSILDGATPSTRAVWVESLDLAASFRLDGLAALMALLVAGIGVAVVLYARAYFADDPSPERVVRFTGFFTLFAGAMLGLVTADDAWTLFTFWELTSVTSFLLIGLDDQVASARAAALRALLVTGAGGLVMLGGLACLVQEAGTADLGGILAAAPTSTTAQVGVALVLVGAFAKSAQVPFHFWLPGAMAAPTPVSAFLHSATMVKAGVIVVARFAPAFAELSWWRPLLVVVGGSTMLVGGVAALRRDDAKQALAFGTVSQLGMLVLLFGVGDHEVTGAAVAVLVAHALFKSGLFLAIGVVDHATGSRDLRRLSGVGRELPWLAGAAALCTLSMVGLPPLVGFVAKESALAALVDADGGWFRIATAVVVAGSVLTTAYSLRIWWGLFGSKSAGAGAGAGEHATVHHRPGWGLSGPVVALGAASLVAGLRASSLGPRLAVAASSLDDRAEVHLALWPGLHLPLLLSTLIIVAGAALAAGLARRALPPSPIATFGERSFGALYSGLLTGAQRVTAVTQSGSLPVYVAVVLAVVAGAIGVALARGALGDWDHVVAADSVLQAAVALLAVVMSVAVVVARRRFVAVLLLGGVGQGLTVLFLMYGAPDLALTQFMIETLMIIAFVLVLRHLPGEFSSPPSWAPRALRVGLSAAVGITVSLFALAAGSVDRATDVTDAVQDLSLPAAGGANVVNVTIVDFRGIDTMFEITVFGIAALGVTNLVAASRRSIGYGRSSRFAKIGAESMIFDQVTRMIFHLTLLVSVYVSLRGHNAPGGGFAGGLIAGAAFVFRILAGGEMERPAVARLSAVRLTAAGMLLAVGSGVGALVAGNEFLETSIFHVDVPLVGDVKLVTSAIFDIGVYLLVIGVVISVLTNLASRTHSGGASRQGAVAP